MAFDNFLPLNQLVGGGGAVLPPHLLFFADAPMKKKFANFSFTPSQSTLKYGSENRPWVRGLRAVYVTSEHHMNKASRKKVLFLVARPLPPTPLLMAGPLN